MRQLPLYPNEYLDALESFHKKSQRKLKSKHIRKDIKRKH